MNRLNPTRLFVFILLLLAAGRSAAQMPARIVFFRMDTEPQQYSRPPASDQHTDALVRDNETIAQLHATGVAVYNPYGAAGVYRVVPAGSGGSGYSNRLELPDLRGGIIFVRVRLSEARPATAQLKLMSFSEFKSYYEKSPALRGSLADAGYLSIDQLTNGFAITPSENILFRTYMNRTERNLKDTLFYDQNGKAATRRGASSFSIALADTGGRFLIRDYYLPEQALKSEYRWLTLDSESKDGACRNYYRSGRLANHGAFAANQETGFWEFYRDTLPQQLWYSCHYKLGKLDSLLISYHRNGHVKRRELHHFYRDTVLANRGDGMLPYVEVKDSIASGYCYDESGTGMPFTPFRTFPKPSYNLGNWLSGILRYPKKARTRGIEGRVKVQFVVNKRGEVEGAEVIRSVDESLDAEALRVVNAMPRWRPGTQDDEPINVYFSLPITFKLD